MIRNQDNPAYKLIDMRILRSHTYGHLDALGTLHNLQNLVHSTPLHLADEIFFFLRKIDEKKLESRGLF